MKKIIIILALTCLFSITAVGCNGNTEKINETKEQTDTETKTESVTETTTETETETEAMQNETKENTYEQISGATAYALMQNEKDYTIIDARTEEEFTQGHIEKAILIPEYEVEQKAPSLLPNKDQLILVYCRSGRRSKIAAEALVTLGYTNVKEFGGIIDWEFETVK